MESLAQKGACRPEVGDEFGQGRNIGQVATALAGDAQLAARPPHLLDHHHRGAGLRRLASGHQPGRTAADDHHARNIVF